MTDITDRNCRHIQQVDDKNIDWRKKSKENSNFTDWGGVGMQKWLSRYQVVI
jgi:hypothetical protein